MSRYGSLAMNILQLHLPVGTLAKQAATWKQDNSDKDQLFKNLCITFWPEPAPERGVALGLRCSYALPLYGAYKNLIRACSAVDALCQGLQAPQRSQQAQRRA